MLDSVLMFADLQELCRPGERPRRGTVERWAKQIGLRFGYDGKGGIFSTVDALNCAIGVPRGDMSEPSLDPLLVKFEI